MSHTSPSPIPSSQEAQQALEQADQARNQLVGSVGYPASYLPLMAFSGAAIPLLGAADAESIPSSAVSSLFLVLGLFGIVASGWALSVFESSNGVRINGFSFGRRLSFAYLAVMILLLIATATVVNGTEAWWAVLLAAPLGAAISVTYAKAWLADFRRHNA